MRLWGCKRDAAMNASSIVAPNRHGVRQRILQCPDRPAMTIMPNMVVEPIKRYDRVRRVTEIHGRLPRRNRSAQSDGPLPDLKESVGLGRPKAESSIRVQRFG
ncbi:hypothetical protein GCM10007857_24170 [Bradyrhizobium iriomotense]|uniref:Uncharacterized protein n=1 Tax=Bradyrhizobium iriomotense TaxID=441950 RepID=A0ABQ6AVY1_9BRAD|nr:hypothetical protein GCM10007857_24170 [Bradyrhizobium iriomotense]